MAYQLHFIGASIGFNRTSLTFLVQEKRSAENGQKRIFWQFFKKPFLTGFYQKSTIIDPPYFLASAMWTRVKSYTFWRKSPKSHKRICQKSWLFRKIWFLWLQLLRILEVYTCARPTSFYSYRVKKSKKFDFVAIFQKISTRDVFCQAYTWYPKFFYVKKMTIFKLWFLAQKVFKMA